MHRSFLRTALTVATLIATAAPALAQTLECTRTRLSSNGFGSNSTAESFFPTHTAFRIDGDTVLGAPYGPGSVLRSDDRVTMTFPLVLSNGKTIPMRIRYNSANGRYAAQLLMPSGYIQNPGAGGRCRPRG
ncbi:MAG: hypothetical protein AAFU80_25610 [Pseudomonadota bacterium]